MRKAFVLHLLPGNEAEYKRRHDALWPEMKDMLKRHGVSDYSIFLHPETLQLFGVLEIANEALFAKVPGTPECRRWWQFMSDIMVYNPDGTPKSEELMRVFHLD